MTIVVVTGLSQEAAVVTGRDGVLVLAGADGLAHLAAGAVAGDCEGIVSWGTAGAINPSLPAGSVSVLSSVSVDGGPPIAADAPWSARIRLAFREAGDARGYSGAHPTATTAAAKKLLWDTFPVDLVDTETWAVAQVAAKAGLPWAGVRSIVDAADEDVPAAAMAGTNPDGSTNVGGIVGGLFRRPFDVVGIVGLSGQFDRAIDGLKRCYAAIGPTMGMPR